MTEKTAKGTDLARGERLQVMLDDAELAAIDDFRFANRMPSRAAAVRELLKRGLESAGYPIAHQALQIGFEDARTRKNGKGHTNGA